MCGSCETVASPAPLISADNLAAFAHMIVPREWPSPTKFCGANLFVLSTVRPRGRTSAVWAFLHVIFVRPLLSGGEFGEDA